MLAIFGLGIAEIIVLLVIGLVLVGVPIALVMALSATKRSAPTLHRDDEIAELRHEIDRLRSEVERLRKGTDKKDPPDPGIVAGPAN